MTTQFMPETDIRGYRRAAIALAGGACASTLLGLDATQAVEMLHAGFSWTCGKLPLADPSTISTEFFRGAALQAAVMATQAADSILRAGAEIPAVIAPQLDGARSFVSTAAGGLGDVADGLYRHGQTVLASWRSGVADSLAVAGEYASAKINSLATSSPEQLIAGAKDLLIDSVDLFVAAQMMRIGYRKVLSWGKRLLGRSGRNQDAGSAPAHEAGLNMQINLHISGEDQAGAIDRAMTQLTDIMVRTRSDGPAPTREDIQRALAASRETTQEVESKLAAERVAVSHDRASSPWMKRGAAHEKNGIAAESRKCENESEMPVIS